MTPRRLILLTALSTLGTTAVGGLTLADTLHLKDGTSVEGDVKRGEAGYVVTLPDGQTTTVPTSSVKSIDVGTSARAAGPDAGLASLRRSTENQTDLHQIIDKYKRFIGQYPGTPAAAEATKDLAVWQDRSGQGMVRVGRDWVTKDQRTKMQQQSLQLADQARQLIKENRWQDAEPLINHALAADPNAATALYLRALMEYQAGQFVPARKDLEAVKSIAPNHGPTLNNLAVITARQNRWGESLSYFDQAMRSDPQNRTILDNVAEALHAVSDDPQKSVQRTLLQRLNTAFQEQDPKLQQTLAAQGLHRWGATWVNDADLAKLQAAQKQIDDKLAQLQTDYDAAQREIQGIDQRIATNDATLRQLESDSYRQDITGRTIIVPLPPLYGQIQQDTQTLRASRQQAVAKLDSLRAQAKSVQRQLPIPQYTGALQMIGADGAPIVLATPTGVPAAQQAPATTTPTASPSTGS